MDHENKPKEKPEKKSEDVSEEKSEGKHGPSYLIWYLLSSLGGCILLVGGIFVAKIYGTKLYPLMETRFFKRTKVQQQTHACESSEEQNQQLTTLGM